MSSPPTTDQIIAYMRHDAADGDDTAFYSEALAAAVQTIGDESDHELVLAPSSSAGHTARTFVPDRCSDLIRIGDCVAVSAVIENGAALTEGVHYQLEPVNPRRRAGMAVPYTELRRLDTNWYANGPRGTVVVTGGWGWAGFSPRTIEAIKVLTKDIIENRDVKHGLVDVTEQAGVSARTNPLVRAEIDWLRETVVA